MEQDSNRISHSSPVKFLKQQVHRLCTIHSSQNCCRPRHSRTVNFPTFNIEQAFYNIKKRANTVELLSHGCWYKNGRNHCCSVAAVVNTCASFGGKNDLISLLLSPSFKSINIWNAGNIIIYFEPAISRQIWTIRNFTRQMIAFSRRESCVISRITLFTYKTRRSHCHRKKFFQTNYFKCECLAPTTRFLFLHSTVNTNQVKSPKVETLTRITAKWFGKQSERCDVTSHLPIWSVHFPKKKIF